MSADHGRVLVVDVGTSSVRAAVVRRRRLVRRRPRARAAARLARRRSRRVRRRGCSPTTCLELARAALADDGPVDAVGISEPARLDDRVGPRDRDAGRARARLAGPAHDRRVPRAPRRRACASGPNQSATKVQWLLDQLDDRGRAADLCFGTVDTWVAWTLSGGALHVTDATNAAVTGLAEPRRVGLGRHRARRSSASPPR